ncbi:MAG: TrkH family potassium uptake protein [Flavobacteriaceae bacterium]
MTALPAANARNAARRIDFAAVISLIGLMTVVLGISMLAPAILDLDRGNPDWQVFVIASGVTTLAGGLAWMATNGAAARLDVREAFLLTGLAWIVLAGFGALPLFFSSLKLDFASAYFEAMSGLTTTGSTVISGLDGAPPGILAWRAILQWIGGVGIIVAAIAVLPELRIGGMQLLRAESSDKSDKILPRVNAIANAVVVIYVSLTALCMACYWIAGMTVVEAGLHAMTTLATGGYSTRDSSIGGFHSASIEWIAVVFMFAASLPFLVYMRVVRGGFRPLIEDPQIRLFAILSLGFVAVQFVYRVVTQGTGAHEAIRHAFFNTATILSTCGFAAVDYTDWGPFHDAIIFLMMFLGGCAGSSAGGLKSLRIGILLGVLRQHIARIIRPHGIFVVRFGSERVSDDVSASVSGFLFMFVAVFAFISLVLNMSGMDAITALSTSATALANVGPGLGAQVGPAGNFAGLSDFQKWVASAAMLLGRLELLTVLVIFIPRYWR